MICSGKIFYEIQAAIKDADRSDVGVMRIEQLYPLNEDKLTELLAPYKKTKKVAWVQEEPKNIGPWPHLHTTLIRALGKEPDYYGRRPASAPAVGSHRRHQQEQQEIIDQALNSKD